MALVWIETENKKSGPIVETTKPLFSKKLALRLLYLTGINLPHTERNLSAKSLGA